jgi:hypothetical protein
MRNSQLKAILATFVVAFGTVSCSSTPQHSNTLIFGTNTVVALDVSQLPTGNMGITLGYRKQEVVWMPLLANTTSASGAETPATCQSDSCKTFNGTTGTDGETDGTGARDTYSVLATFSGQSAGGSLVSPSGAGVTGGGAIAQYIATGFAARALAESGAAVVNTNVSTANVSAEATRTRSIATGPQTKDRKLGRSLKNTSSD